MVQDMVTDKQFQGFARPALAQMKSALKESPGNKELQELKDIFQGMLEDGSFPSQRAALMK